EDLGLITPEVEALRDRFGFPGMHVLQFAFGGDARNPHLPHNHRDNAIAYTGTHDNDTSAGWYGSAGRKVRAHLQRYAPGEEEVCWKLIRLAWSSVARIAIAPVQDLLGLESTCRMNIPGTCEGNWQWRLGSFAELRRPLARLK